MLTGNVKIKAVIDHSPYKESSGDIDKTAKVPIAT